MTDIFVERLVVKRGSRRVLDELSLHVRAGERVAIIGPNGAGKTTLIRAILGLEVAHSGSVSLDSTPTSQMKPFERAAKVAWLPQQALVDEPITTLEFVLAARYRIRESLASAKIAARKALESVDAEDWADRTVTRLSGGERQRVALAALFAQESSALLLDEPANHLDPAQQVGVWRLLSRVASNSAILVVTHDVNLIPLLGDVTETRIVALESGRVAFDTRANDPSLAERLSDLYGMQMHGFSHAGRHVFVPHLVKEPNA